MTENSYDPSAEEQELVMRIILYVKTHHRVTLSQVTKALNLDSTDSQFMEQVLTKSRSQDDNPEPSFSFCQSPTN